MNFLNIALKEIKRDIRDRWTLIFMLVFPILLILILGVALSNSFSSTPELGEIRVLVQDKTGGGPLTQSFDAFAKAVEESGVKFESWSEGMDGRKEVEQHRYDDYVELTESGISLYGSSRSAIESSIVQGMLAAFTDKYKAGSVLAQAGKDTAVMQAEGTGEGKEANYIKETSIVADRKPGAVDYYALAMTCMVALWGAWSASRLITSEVRQGTSMRLVAAPVSKGSIFAGKILGSIGSNMLCVFLIIIISKFLFKAYWGDHLLAVVAVLFTEVILAVSLGLAVGYLFNGTASRNVLMIITQLAAFFGGAYFPMSVDGDLGVVGWIAGLSPIRWGNVALTKIVYSGETAAMWPVIGLNIGLAVLMLMASAVLMRRKEGI
ncbi:ABC-2 type transport system permease protein [Fontibacillus phaseoli]|uniref:ABC-2 type transport system permease protein n=1 Tax=Fontibacillus phaseoli TaxID=1416533 RepID=A0A369BQM8_9BACL|nr:ABC transporter permease [Fontibacillus phaseoli]RCX22767.1 ABC-2 type transport system permease protein [Fontibacillus phaseoli]